MTNALPARAIEWVAAGVSGVRAVRVIEQFVGATTSSLHAIEVDRYGEPPLALVLRRYTDARIREAEPQYPRTEAAALRALDGAPGVVAPRLVAFDETGEACDVPAVLMTRVDGRSSERPANDGVWVRGLARALAAVHCLDGAAIEERYQRWHRPETTQPPQATTQTAAWMRLIEASRSLEPSGEIVLLHRDYHPGNVLWVDSRVSGIVDWPNACRGVAALDAGHCRRDLVITHGVPVADAFLAAYVEASGSAPDPLCDALALLDSAQSNYEFTLEAYHAYGHTNLTPELIRARLDEYVALIASRL